MAFCPSCGAAASGRFCASCGATLDTASAPGSAPSSAPAAGMGDNAAGALCYVLGLVTGILLLVIAPYNQSRFVRFHAFQSIFFNIAIVALWIAFTIVATILVQVPVLGWIVKMLLWAALSIGILVCWLLLMWRAYNNEKWALPFIGPLAEKQS